MIATAVKRPILTFVVFAILTLAGIYSMLNTKTDLFPDVSLPSISIITFYPGASSEDVEKLITKPIEEAISTVPNIKNIRSFSQENISTVIVEFNEGTNLDEAVNDIRDELDIVVPFLPDDAQRPNIVKFNLSSFPIMVIGMYSEDTLRDLRKEFDEIKDELQRIKGVGQVMLFGGGRKRRINVFVDKVKMEAYGLTLQDVYSQISSSNRNIPLGNVEYGYTDYLVRLEGTLETPEDVEELPITTRSGKTIKLKDIANVSYAYEKRTNYINIDGREGIIFAIFKQSGANAVEVAELSKKKLDELSKKYNFKYVIALDFSRSVKSAIATLRRDLLLGAIFVILTTFLILRNIRASLIISIAIPISLISAFIYLFAVGSTINIISLSALTLAVGMVVDDAIVVMENIFYHRERGETPQASAIFGTREVSQAIVASTLTRSSVVLPLLFASGFVGLFFRELAVSIIITLMVSLIVSFTLTPMLSSRFLGEPKPPSTAIGRFLERTLESLETFHRKVLVWSTRHNILALFIGIGIFVSSLGLFAFVRTEFIPTTDTGEMTLTLKLPSGAKLDETKRIMSIIEDTLEAHPFVESFMTRVGKTETGFSTTRGAEEASNFGEGFIKLVPLERRDKSVEEIALELERKFMNIPGIERISVSPGSQANQIIFGISKPIVIEIYGEDLDELDEISTMVERAITKVQGIKSVSKSLSKSKPEIHIKVDRQKLSTFGIPLELVGMYIRMAINGVSAGKIRHEGQDLDIWIQLDTLYTKDVSILRTLRIPTLSGSYVYLSDIASINYSVGPTRIERKNKQRMVKVEADYFGRSLGEVYRDVRRAVENIPLPSDMDIRFAGTIERQAESFQQLTIAFLLSIVILFLIMAGQLNSFKYPLIILLSIPFSVSGVAIIFALTRAEFSIVAFVGMIMVGGIALSNAILMTDYMNILRERGYSKREAIIMGASRRLRPILITTLTVIFGMLPMAMLKGEGSEMFHALGLAVIGGLAFSTLITLFFIPTVYSIVER